MKLPNNYSPRKYFYIQKIFIVFLCYRKKKSVNLYDYAASQVWEYDIFTLGFYFHCYQLKPIWLLVFHLPTRKRGGGTSLIVPSLLRNIPQLNLILH